MSRASSSASSIASWSARALEVEFGQLQLESSTWGLHSRVEKIAAGALGMRAPDPRRVRMVEVKSIPSP